MLDLLVAADPALASFVDALIPPRLRFAKGVAVLGAERAQLVARASWDPAGLVWRLELHALELSPETRLVREIGWDRILRVAIAEPRLPAAATALLTSTLARGFRLAGRDWRFLHGRRGEASACYCVA